MKKNTILILVLFLATFLRLYQIGSLPISLFGDEVDVGYHAWSLWTTGKDYMGHFLPIYIQSLAEWRAPLLMYLTAPFVGVLGPSTLSVRLFPALMGILNIYLIYKLVLLLPFYQEDGFKRTKKLANIAAFLLAITPWHLHYSRASFEVTLLVSLIFLGTILFLKNKISLSFAVFALTFYTYSTANIFVPLLIIGLLVINKTKIKTIFASIIPAFIICLPIGYQIVFGHASSRFGLISIFNDPKVTEQVIINRTQPWIQNNFTESLFHNKYLLYFQSFLNNYLSSFSPQFLFLSGDPNFRHSIGEFGEFLWPTIFLVPIFIYYLSKNKMMQGTKLVLWWLAISPIASSLTVGGGTHSTRLFVMIPALVIIFSLGLNELKKPLINIFVASILLVLITYWHRYSYHYRYLSFKEWNYGYSQIFSKLSNVQDGYNNIFINNTYQPSLIQYAFYTKINPKDFQKMYKGDKTTNEIYPEFNGFLFGNNTYFGEAISPYVIDHITANNGIYLSAQGREAPGNWDWIKDAPGGTKSLGGIYDPLGQPLFHLIVSNK